MIRTTNNRHRRRVSMLQERRRYVEQEQRERVARATGHREGYALARDEMARRLAVPDESGVQVVRLNEEPKSPIVRVLLRPRPFYRAIEEGVVDLKVPVPIVEFEAKAFAMQLSPHQAVVWYVWERR